MNKLPLLALFLLAACPEQLGQQCPAHSVAVGQYTLDFVGQHDAGECIATQGDGGVADVTRDAGGTLGATLCFGQGADGGPQLQLLVAGKGVRPSDLLPDAGFHFVSPSSAGVTGTACGCANGVTIGETIDGYLLTSQDGGVAIQADGGLPLITGLAATLVDTLTPPTDTTSCLCTMPCSATYTIIGTRF
jgi:hypothetical protein